METCTIILQKCSNLLSTKNLSKFLTFMNNLPMHAYNVVKYTCSYQEISGYSRYEKSLDSEHIYAHLVY